MSKEILRILEIVKEEHLKDVEFSKKNDSDLYGLCAISNTYLKSSEHIIFKEYLKNNNPTDKKIYGYLWSIENTNTERIEWLDKHIELNS
jgi:hypothetical protein